MRSCRQEEDQSGRDCDKGDTLAVRSDLGEGKSFPENIPCLHIGEESAVSPDVFLIHIDTALDDRSHVTGQVPVQTDAAVLFIFPDAAAHTVEEESTIRRADFIEDRQMGNIGDMCFWHYRILSENRSFPVCVNGFRTCANSFSCTGNSLTTGREFESNYFYYTEKCCACNILLLINIVNLYKRCGVGSGLV